MQGEEGVWGKGVELEGRSKNIGQGIMNIQLALHICGSASANSTNWGSEILGGKFQKVPKSKT